MQILPLFIVILSVPFCLINALAVAGAFLTKKQTLRRKLGFFIISAVGYGLLGWSMYPEIHHKVAHMSSFMQTIRLVGSIALATSALWYNKLSKQDLGRSATSDAA
jgi:hypothetical protein